MKTIDRDGSITYTEADEPVTEVTKENPHLLRLGVSLIIGAFCAAVLSKGAYELVKWIVR